MDVRTGPTISEKIALANSLYLLWGDALKTNLEISARLEELLARVEASNALSLRSGVAEACKICEEEEGGSCCGVGIENRYSPELLLINLLLGVKLPEARNFSGSCYFLGDAGCLLKAREILCINYLCAKLKKSIPSEALLQLQEVNGAEMDLLFLLTERVKGYIRQKSL